MHHRAFSFFPFAAAIFIAITVLLHAAPPAMAEMPGEPITVSSYVKKLYARAVDGDADSQNRLGIAYEKGFDVGRNFKTAFAWYSMAADQRYAKAQFNLGLMYMDGKGIPKDDAEAVRLFRMAAKQDLPQAKEVMGRMYWQGRGVRKDEEKSFEMFLEAAELGQTNAMAALIKLYAEGTGVKQDLLKSYAWLATVETYADLPKFQHLQKDIPALKKGLKEAMDSGDQRKARKLAETYIDKYGRK